MRSTGGVDCAGRWHVSREPQMLVSYNSSRMFWEQEELLRSTSLSLKNHSGEEETAQYKRDTLGKNVAI